MLNIPAPRLTLGFALADDLQDEGMMLDHPEQNALRTRMALRAMRKAAARGDLSEVDLDVVEMLLARWWRAWSPAMPETAVAYGVQITTGAIAEVCGIDVLDAAASLQHLTDCGLVEPTTEPWDADDDDGPTVMLVGAFAPVLKDLDPVLFRDFVRHHKTELRRWARAYLDTTDEQVGYAAEIRAEHPDTPALIADWKVFTSGPKCVDLFHDWDQQPSAVYDWFDTLAVLQERASMIACYPSTMESVRKRMGEMLPERIAILSACYAADD